ncbi:MAG: phosphoglucomutase/phosphomannomutase family protein [Firmicutes bacterium]|nr:phosphoglucomutase/phosphomannomutase family protein [Bacillota bacterium]
MIRFGTGGWRAIIGDDFVKENVYKVGQAVYEYLKRHDQLDKPVVIGYDRRFLSRQASWWLIEVLAGNGIKVLAMKRSAPTPLTMHIVKTMGLHAGLEVTASHNPPEYNGIKMFTDEGRDAALEVTEELESILDALRTEDIKAMPKEEVETAGLVEYLKNPFNPFIDDILAQMNMDVIRERGLRILLNPMHGSGIYPLMTIFYTTRCTVDVINDQLDAYFGGHMPAPTEETLKDLIHKVVDEKYDLGIAVDGDGDRLGIIDSNGRYISANEILVMLYYYLHEYKGWKGPVVRNLATTHMLDAVAKSFGEVCYEVPVGFKYISSKIDETDAVLGGESSGGLTVRGHIHGKDSIYAAALFIEMVAAIGKSPSEFMDELVEKYGHFEMVESNLRFAPEKKPEINDLLMVQKQLPDFGRPIARVSYEDGCKVYFADNSFIICRFSGTEPLLRIFAESERQDKAQDYIERFKKFIGI